MFGLLTALRPPHRFVLRCRANRARRPAPLPSLRSQTRRRTPVRPLPSTTRGPLKCSPQLPLRAPRSAKIALERHQFDVQPRTAVHVPDQRHLLLPQRNPGMGSIRRSRSSDAGGGQRDDWRRCVVAESSGRQVEDLGRGGGLGVADARDALLPADGVPRRVRPDGDRGRTERRVPRRAARRLLQRRRADLPDSSIVRTALHTRASLPSQCTSSPPT